MQKVQNKSVLRKTNIFNMENEIKKKMFGIYLSSVCDCRNPIELLNFARSFVIT